MSIGPTCPLCGWVHPSNAARVIGYFRPVPPGYQATDVPGAPVRPTRAVAERDWCEHKRRRARERAAFAALLQAEGDEMDEHETRSGASSPARPA